MTTPEMKPPVEHELKCWPIFFQAVKRGEKTFELRSNDRNFHLDDTLWLREYRPQNGESEMPGYTGEELRVKVTYVLSSETFLQKGVVALGFTRPTPQPTSEYVKAVEALEEMKLFAARLESGIQMRLVPWDGMTEESEIAHYHADEILKAYRAQVTKEGADGK